MTAVNAANEEFFTIEDLSKRWKKHQVTLRKMIAAKELPRHYKIGGSIRFRVSDIKKYEKSRAV